MRIAVELVTPSMEHLPSYLAAVERGWSIDRNRTAEAAREELAKILANPVLFVASMTDREAKGEPVKLPDGSVVARLPGFHKWLWDGEFCGSIGLRWQKGTTAMPPHCLGHIGYAVVHWKQRHGYARRALTLMLTEARAVGLPFVEVTTEPENVASQRVIEANGGELFERFTRPVRYGSTPGLRYRIRLE